MDVELDHAGHQVTATGETCHRRPRHVIGAGCTAAERGHHLHVAHRRTGHRHLSGRELACDCLSTAADLHLGSGEAGAADSRHARAKHSSTLGSRVAHGKTGLGTGIHERLVAHERASAAQTSCTHDRIVCGHPPRRAALDDLGRGRQGGPQGLSSLLDCSSKVLKLLLRFSWVGTRGRWQHIHAATKG